MEIQTIKSIIETAYADPEQMDPKTASATTREAVLYTIQLLNEGRVRVAEKQEGNWQVNTWLKQAILLHFRLQPLQIMDAEYTAYHDRIPLKFSRSRFEQSPDVRVVPPAHARFGAYIAPNTILMPSYINIGAYVDSGTMIDTWATVGSCAQIGKNVHLSGGAGIGGVLEPIQSSPTIIEDDCFIGARSEIAEGVIVETGAVIGMGVFIGQSTKIFDRATGEITYGRVPAGSVIVAGNLPSKTGEYSLYAAIIVKRVDAKTRSKTTLNQLLRDE